MDAPVYLDYNATTPVAPEVATAMQACLTRIFGNASSGYARGREAAAVITEARACVARLIGAKSDEIVFTGCATESNNLALLGVARALGPQKRHLVVSAVEHPSVTEPARQLERDGWQLTVVRVNGQGRVAVSDVAAAIRPQTALVSIMHANNEVGTLQPIAEIAALLRARGVLLHTDAAQSIGKLDVDVDRLGVDLLSLAGHKFYATKGVGALYVRAGTPIRNILFGAGQERGLRPGTENVPAIAGIGAAARLMRERMPAASTHLRQLRDALYQRLQEAIPDLRLNGDPIETLPNTLNLSFPKVSGRELLNLASTEVEASVGSACHSERDAVSGVLAAMAMEPARAMGAVRLSIGQMTTAADIERAADALIARWRQWK